MNSRNVGDIIKELLKENNMKQKDLVEKLGLDVEKGKGLVSNWIRNNNIPSDYYLTQLSEIFGVSTSYIKGETVIRDADNETICDATDLKEDIVDILGDNKRTRQIFNEYRTDYLGSCYKNATVQITQSGELFAVILEEFGKIMYLYKDKKARKKFNKTISDIDESIDVKSMLLNNAQYRISEKVCDLFKYYLKKELEKDNIDIDDFNLNEDKNKMLEQK